MTKQHFSTGKAAKYLGVSIRTLQRWDNEGTLTASRLPSGRRVYSKEDLDAAVKKPEPKVEGE